VTDDSSHVMLRSIVHLSCNGEDFPASCHTTLKRIKSRTRTWTRRNIRGMMRVTIGPGNPLIQIFPSLCAHLALPSYQKTVIFPETREGNVHSSNESVRLENGWNVNPILEHRLHGLRLGRARRPWTWWISSAPVQMSGSCLGAALSWLRDGLLAGVGRSSLTLRFSWTVTLIILGLGFLRARLLRLCCTRQRLLSPQSFYNYARGHCEVARSFFRLMNSVHLISVQQ